MTRVPAVAPSGPILYDPGMPTGDAKTTFHITAELKQAVLERCQATEMSMNDLIVGWIADELGARFEPEGRKSMARPTAGVVMLRVPRPVHKKLRTRLFRDSLTLQEWVTRLIEEQVSRPFTRVAA